MDTIAKLRKEILSDDYNYQFGDIQKLIDQAKYVRLLEKEITRLHNPHTGEECNCCLCNQ